MLNSTGFSKRESIQNKSILSRILNQADSLNNKNTLRSHSEKFKLPYSTVFLEYNIGYALFVDNLR